MIVAGSSPNYFGASFSLPSSAIPLGRSPEVLFEGPYQPTLITIPNYDVSSDGQRFLMLKPSEQEQAETQINVVLNWFEELKRRVPTKH